MDTILDDTGLGQVNLLLEYLADPAADPDWAFGLGNMKRGYTHALIRQKSTLIQKAQKWRAGNGQKDAQKKTAPPMKTPTPEEIALWDAEDAKEREETQAWLAEREAEEAQRRRPCPTATELADAADKRDAELAAAEIKQPEVTRAETEQFLKGHRSVGPI